MSNKQTHSIQIRIKRVTVEDAFVAVPVTKSVMKEKEDGSLGVDSDRLLQEALKLGKESDVEWKVEDVVVGPHEAQGPKPEDRTMFVPDNSEIDWFEGQPTSGEK